MITFKILTGPELPVAELEMPVDQRVSWPIDSMVMYAYSEEGKVIGRIGTMSLKVIEGAWAAPGHTALAFHLLKRMESLSAYLGSTHVLALTYDETPQIREYLKRVGYEKEPLELYSHKVVEKKEVA